MAERTTNLPLSLRLAGVSQESEDVEKSVQYRGVILLVKIGFKISKKPVVHLQARIGKSSSSSSSSCSARPRLWVGGRSGEPRCGSSTSPAILPLTPSAE